MQVDDDRMAIKFNQLFHLLPHQVPPRSTPASSLTVRAKGSQTNFWVHNDIFRLNY